MDISTRTVRQDVRELGALVGDVIRAQASPDAYETVESVRTASVAARRDDDDDAGARVRELLSDLATTGSARWRGRSLRPVSRMIS